MTVTTNKSAVKAWVTHVAGAKLPARLDAGLHRSLNDYLASLPNVPDAIHVRSEFIANDGFCCFDVPGVVKIGITVELASDFDCVSHETDMKDMVENKLRDYLDDRLTFGEMLGHVLNAATYYMF